MGSEHAELDTFGSSFGGTLLLPGQSAYDQARAIWNGSIDRHPSAIARCTDAAAGGGRRHVRAGAAIWRSRCAAAGTTSPASH